MSYTIAFPELYKAAGTDYVDRPYLLEGKRIWQQCYLCGHTITFKQDGGKWLSIGAGLIRHKSCEPPPLTR